MINIYINQLFKKWGSEPDTNARIRLRLNVAAEHVIPANRDVRIFLFKLLDLESKPLYNLSFTEQSASGPRSGPYSRVRGLQASLWILYYAPLSWTRTATDS